MVFNVMLCVIGIHTCLLLPPRGCPHTIVHSYQRCALRGPYLPSEMQLILNAMVRISFVNWVLLTAWIAWSQALPIRLGWRGQTSLHVVWTEPFTRLCLRQAILVANTVITNGVMTSTRGRRKFRPLWDRIGNRQVDVWSVMWIFVLLVSTSSMGLIWQIM